MKINKYPIKTKFSQKNYCYLTDKLSLKNLREIIHSKAVLYTNGGETNHMMVICKILGIPLVKINKKNHYKDNDVIIQKNNKLYYENKVIYEYEIKDKVKINKNYEFQVSIFSSNDVKKINKINKQPKQFFLRNEFIWMGKNINPFDYIGKFSVESASNMIYEELKNILTIISKDQIINFRSFDMRSDELIVFGDEAVVEPNPHLGLHGIRQLLVEKNLLLAELMAINKLSDEGYDNIIFSLPFITIPEEFEKVKIIAEKNFNKKINFGLFIENPSAIYHLRNFIDLGICNFYIGMKDLIQFITATDRKNDSVAHLYNPTSEAVIYYVKKLLDTANKHNVTMYLFTQTKDINSYAEQFNNLKNLSLFSADYIGLFN